MIQSTHHPKILVVALGRINSSDTYNNGLFLRNLFGADWPRENLAQIYSSGNTGDQGFFGRYYCLGARDRIFGSIFYAVKHPERIITEGDNNPAQLNPCRKNSLLDWLKRKAQRLLVETGCYELIFQPRVSKEMMTWVNEFKPDIILAQGYNLTFTWLPLMLKKRTGAKLAVLTTDDWPKYLYAGLHGEPTLLKWLMVPLVKKYAKALFQSADFPFAFGSPMANEYKKRYGRNFSVVNHSDDPERFKQSLAYRFLEKNIFSIVAVGAFNRHRYPLLLDLNEACAILNNKGHNVAGVIFSSGMDPDGQKKLESATYINVLPDPGNDALPSRLKGADILLLAEGFDEKYVSAIDLSVSSKAHLFMFAQKPIIVYAERRTGIARYAENLRWAHVVSERSSYSLATAIEDIISHPDKAQSLTDIANAVATRYHTHRSNRETFSTLLSEVTKQKATEEALV